MENIFLHKRAARGDSEASIHRIPLVPMSSCIEARAGVAASLRKLCLGVEHSQRGQQALNGYVATCVGEGTLQYVLLYAAENCRHLALIELALVRLPEDWWNAVAVGYRNLLVHPVLQIVAHRRRLEVEVRNLIETLAPQEGPADCVEMFEELMEENEATHPTSQSILWAKLVWGLEEMEHLAVCDMAFDMVPQHLGAICQASSFSKHASVRRWVLEKARSHRAPLFGPLALTRLQNDADPVVRFDADRLASVNETAKAFWVGGSYRVKNAGASSEVLVVWGHRGAEDLKLDYSILRFRNSLLQQASGSVDRKPHDVISVIDNWSHAGENHTECSEAVCRRILLDLPLGGVVGSVEAVQSRLWAEYARQCLA